MRQNEGRSAKLNETCRREKRREERKTLCVAAAATPPVLLCAGDRVSKTATGAKYNQPGREGEREGELSVQGTATEEAWDMERRGHETEQRLVLRRSNRYSVRRRMREERRRGAIA